jgi:hypothetical protein
LGGGCHCSIENNIQLRLHVIVYLRHKYRSVDCHDTSSQESLDVDFQGAGWVLKLVLLQNSGVQDAKGANGQVLAADAGVDGGGVAGEEGWVCEKKGMLDTN